MRLLVDAVSIPKHVIMLDSANFDEVGTFLQLKYSNTRRSLVPPNRYLCTQNAQSQFEGVFTGIPKLTLYRVLNNLDFRRQQVDDLWNEWQPTRHQFMGLTSVPIMNHATSLVHSYSHHAWGLVPSIIAIRNLLTSLRIRSTLPRSNGISAFSLIAFWKFLCVVSLGSIFDSLASPFRFNSCAISEHGGRSSGLSAQRRYANDQISSSTEPKLNTELGLVGSSPLMSFRMICASFAVPYGSEPVRT